mgnify:CR=1 FL=1
MLSFGNVIGMGSVPHKKICRLLHIYNSLSNKSDFTLMRVPNTHSIDGDVYEWTVPVDCSMDKVTCLIHEKSK